MNERERTERMLEVWETYHLQRTEEWQRLLNLWHEYHQARLKREAFDRWLFWTIGLLVGLAIGMVLGVMVR